MEVQPQIESTKEWLAARSVLTPHKADLSSPTQPTNKQPTQVARALTKLLLNSYDQVTDDLFQQRELTFQLCHTLGLKLYMHQHVLAFP